MGERPLMPQVTPQYPAAGVTWVHTNIIEPTMAQGRSPRTSGCAPRIGGGHLVQGRGSQAASYRRGSGVQTTADAPIRGRVQGTQGRGQNRLTGRMAIW